MSENKNTPVVQPPGAQESRADLLSLLSRLGMKTLHMKLFLLIFLLTAFSLVLTFVVAYLGFYSVLQTNPDMLRAADTMRPALLLIGFGSALVMTVVAYFFSGNLSRKIGRFLTATEEIRSGNLNARVQIKTGDELEKVAAGFNQMMDRLSETIKGEDEQRAALRQSEERYRSILTSM